MFKKCCHCKKQLRSSNKTGYCWECFEKNTDGIKTKYNKAYRESNGLTNTSLIYTCVGCNKFLKKGTKSGYCGKCFHINVNGVKTKYLKKRWRNGLSKISHWRNRGIILTEDDIVRHDKTNCCEICENILLNDKVMDHCHQTGKYRGTLCRQCNVSIGKLGDCLDVIISRIYKYKNAFQNRDSKIAI